MGLWIVLLLFLDMSQSFHPLFFLTKFQIIESLSRSSRHLTLFSMMQCREPRCFELFFSAVWSSEPRNSKSSAYILQAEGKGERSHLTWKIRLSMMKSTVLNWVENLPIYQQFLQRVLTLELPSLFDVYYGRQSDTELERDFRLVKEKL